MNESCACAKNLNHLSGTFEISVWKVELYYTLVPLVLVPIPPRLGLFHFRVEALHFSKHKWQSQGKYL